MVAMTWKKKTFTIKISRFAQMVVNSIVILKSAVFQEWKQSNCVIMEGGINKLQTFLAVKHWVK